MAVAPAAQRTGIGSALVRAGLQECQRAGAELCVVLGHPDYYPRFGFQPASQLGLSCKWPVPDEVFMALEFIEGAARGGGRAHYHPFFDEVG